MWARMNEEVQLLNGEVWESPLGVRGIAQWLDDDDWVLLSEPHSSGIGTTRMEALPHGGGAICFSQAELSAWFLRNGWRKVNAKVALQVA